MKFVDIENYTVSKKFRLQLKCRFSDRRQNDWVSRDLRVFYSNNLCLFSSDFVENISFYLFFFSPKFIFYLEKKTEPVQVFYYVNMKIRKFTKKKITHF